jgi:hypothetical protein
VTGRAFEDLMVALVPLLAHGDGGALDAVASATAHVLTRDHVTVALADGDDLVAYGASSALARRGHDLQLTTGEGPTLDARSGHVRIDDLGDDGRYPVVAPGLIDLGVVGIDARPIRADTVVLGSLTAFLTDDPAAVLSVVPTGADLGDAVAAAVARAILRSGPLDRTAFGAVPDVHRDEPFAWLLDDAGGPSAAFHQACGMVAIQIGCDMTEARLRLRAHAFAEDRTPLDLARAIVERRVRLER